MADHHQNFGLVIPFANFKPQSPALPFMESFMNDTQKNFEKFRNEATASTRQSVEAYAKSGTVIAKGWEQLIRTSVELAQNSAERQSSAVKELMSCKTLTELTETQTRIAQSNFEDMMQAATKLSEISVKIATDAFEPINEEVSRTLNKTAEAA